MSKYVDITAITQVIGTLYNHPDLLDEEDKYRIYEEDFVEDFHKIVFGSIYKLHELGVKEMSLENISDFLHTREKSLAIYSANKGEEYLLRVSNSANLNTFDYYYNRLKKFTLLRMYYNYGVDVSFIYDDDNIFDLKKKEKQEELLDNYSLFQIADLVDDKIMEVRNKYAEGVEEDTYQAGEGIFDLIDNLKKYPEVGIPMYGPLINTVTRGARLKKFYLRSAATGVGKTRTMIADACYFACDYFYDENFGWIKNGQKEPTLYITTEQEVSEIQTMMLAFLSGINEEHIINGKYVDDEEDRIERAAEVLADAPLYIKELPDFSLDDVENVIKQNIRDYGVKYVCHDYIHSSLKILAEIGTKTGGMKLREDNILFMLSTRLKDLCNKYEIFLLSATQLNAQYQDSETPDQNLLRGAKAIADKVDLGAILLSVTEDDLKKLEGIVGNSSFEKPTIKMSIYKNRRGRYKGIYLWCKADLGTCRVKPMFATTFGYEILKIDNLQIKVESAF